MEFGSALMGLIVVGLIAVPVYLLLKNASNREKQFVRALFQLADRTNSHIDEYDAGRDFVIGLDRISSKVFFYKNVEGVQTEEVVQLKDIARIECKTISRGTAPDNGGRKPVDRILLIFHPIEKEAATSWEIYNASENLQLSGELQLAEKWCRMLTEYQLKLQEAA